MGVQWPVFKVKKEIPGKNIQVTLTSDAVKLSGSVLNADDWIKQCGLQNRTLETVKYKIG